MIDVIVSGHLCLDLIPYMPNVSAQAMGTPGALVEVGPMALSTGGPVSNTGLALHRLGADVRLMASVGDDLIGQAIIGYLRNRDHSLSQYITLKAAQPSSYSVVLSPGGADRTFLHCTGQNSTFSAADIDFFLLSRARLFHLGYAPLLPRLLREDGAELRAIYQQAKVTGVITSLDMSRPDPNSFSGQVDWRRILQNALPYVDIFLPSIEEILFALRRSDYEAWRGAELFAHLDAAYLAQLADELLAMGSVMVGFKLGEYGLYLRTGDVSTLASLRRVPIDLANWANQTLWTAAYQVKVVGTTGAGDSAYAGFLVGLLRGLDPLPTMRLACAVGACNVEAADSTSGVRTFAETSARLNAGWPLRSERLLGM